jgi:hypothetical protein
MFRAIGRDMERQTHESSGISRRAGTGFSGHIELDDAISELKTRYEGQPASHA